jgi:hypothetical protein
MMAQITQDANSARPKRKQPANAAGCPYKRIKEFQATVISFARYTS